MRKPFVDGVLNYIVLQPYPAPPAPNPRALLGQGFRGMRGGPRPTMMMSPAMRPKTRGERGGKNALTAGKLAKLKELAVAGVPVPSTLQGQVQLLSSVGFIPPGPHSKCTNDPNSSGGAQGPSLLAAARAAAGNQYEDPFAPSAAEKRLLSQQQNIHTRNSDP